MLVVTIAVWELLVTTTGISELIIPRPMTVIITFTHEFEYLIYNGAVTLLEAGVGFILGSVAAILVSMLFQRSRYMESALFPYAVILKSIPLVALAPIVVLWFGTRLASKIVLASLVSFFPVLVGFNNGLKSIPKEAVDVFMLMSANKWETMFKLRIPYALPELFNGLKISATFSVVGAVVAEFIGASQGIGYVVKSSSYYAQTELTFAAIIVSAICSLIMFYAVARLENAILFWRKYIVT